MLPRPAHANHAALERRPLIRRVHRQRHQLFGGQRMPRAKRARRIEVAVVVVAARIQPRRWHILDEIDVRANRQQQRQPNEAGRRRIALHWGGPRVQLQRRPQVPDGARIDEVGVRWQVGSGGVLLVGDIIVKQIEVGLEEPMGMV